MKNRNTPKENKISQGSEILIREKNDKKKLSITISQKL